MGAAVAAIVVVERAGRCRRRCCRRGRGRRRCGRPRSWSQTSSSSCDAASDWLITPSISQFIIIIIDGILNYLPAARIPATAWVSRGRLSCLKEKEKTLVTLNMKRAKCIPPSFIMQLVELSMKYLWQILSQKLWSPSPPPLPSFQLAANTTWHE